MRSVLRFLLIVAAFVGEATSGVGQEAAWQTGRDKPKWHKVASERTRRIDFDGTTDAAGNGRKLAAVMRDLRPGDRLLIGAGRYEIEAKLVLNLVGEATRPIRIEAADLDHPPVLTRNARQNLLNVGEGGSCRFVLLRGLELVGGSVAIRLHDVSDFWLDRCHIHHSEHGGITANTRDTQRLFVTGNHLHDFHHGTAEGMYLGANHGKAVMSDSVIAGNHVHDCRGEQGDGIEVKQGSRNNWVVGNHVHDTNYPCILVYGTDGKGVNVIERNVCYRSSDHTMQVQGDAIVRNNLIVAGKHAGFSSTDHQGKSANLRFVHNTVINEGVGANLSSWGGRQGMVFANNAVYSRRIAVRFPRGSDGVRASGNVVWPQVPSGISGFVVGAGLQDFRDVSWDGESRDARPSEESLLAGKGKDGYRLPTDLRKNDRRDPPTAGALEAP